MQKPKILVVDDRRDIVMSARIALEKHNFEVCEAYDIDRAKIQIKAHQPQLVLLDMNYSRDTTSGEEGLSFLSWLSNSEFDIPVVVMTAWSNVALAVEALRLGAGDFIEKPWKNQRLIQVVKRQLELSNLSYQNKRLRQQLQMESGNFYQWRSECMLQLYRELDRAAEVDVAVLITGENGTGKSQLAKYIHEKSARSSQAFVSVNMGGISETLFESEMFGHKRGAFTDAKNHRIGRFELASNGTLFLDEIGNIPLSQQVKLLRVLETNEYEILGSSHPAKCDIRLICATNSDIKTLLDDKVMRADFYYRLNTFEISLPPLRKRRDDIIPLSIFYMNCFVNKYSRQSIILADEAAQALLDYSWPGNIRELSHVLERAVLLCDGTILNVEDLRISASKRIASELPFMTLEEAEKKLIKQAMFSTDNNVPKAAALLGLTKSSLYRRLEKYAIFQE